MNEVYLSLGSNQGDRIKWMQEAIRLLTDGGCIILKQSSFYETKAWGLTDQPDFLNMCLQLSTNLNFDDLLTLIHQTENQLGRQRHIKWGPRTLDIDILFFNHETISTETLVVPHPYLQERRFVLMPLAEIAANFVHPVFGKTIAQLLEECGDELEVKEL